MRNLEKMKLDPTSHGITYQNRAFMLDGYISDFNMSYEENGEKERNLSSLKNNKGYVDDEGYIWIYWEKEPEKSTSIPYFTIEVDGDAQPKFNFSKWNTPETRRAFNIDNVGDCSLDYIKNHSTKDDVTHNDEAVIDVYSSTNAYLPEINDTDDFLKKVVKTAIIEKKVNLNKYKNIYGTKKYTLTNMRQALAGKTKMSPTVFLMWAEILGFDFEVNIVDNGKDKGDNFTGIIHYDSTSDTVTKE